MASSPSALPTAASLLGIMPTLPPLRVSTPSILPTFNYHEMSAETLRGILRVTSSVHPEAALIGEELRRMNRHAARDLRSLYERAIPDGSDELLEEIRHQAWEALEQDDHDRTNMCSSGMSLVCLDPETREIYEEVLRLVMVEIDARAIEASPHEAQEAEAEQAADYAAEDAIYAEEEAERQKLIAEGKCPDCHREAKLYANRFGECLGCKDDDQDAEEKEARREERAFFYMLGLRHSRRTGQPC